MQRLFIQNVVNINFFIIYTCHISRIRCVRGRLWMTYARHLVKSEDKNILAGSFSPILPKCLYIPILSKMVFIHGLYWHIENTRLALNIAQVYSARLRKSKIKRLDIFIFKTDFFPFFEISNSLVYFVISLRRYGSNKWHQIGLKTQSEKGNEIKIWSSIQLFFSIFIAHTSTLKCFCLKNKQKWKYVF